MPINYLCIDDDNSEIPEALLSSIENKTDKKLEFLKRIKPEDIGSDILKIKAAADASKDGFGLILDLRLDSDPVKDGLHVSYRGSTLAQELRTRMIELGNDAIESFPIVLWTVDAKFKRSYENDDTSHDLFDAVYIKDGQLVTRKQDIVANQLLSLVEGYKLIKQAKKTEGIDLQILLGSDEGTISNLDARIDLDLTRTGERSIHECARFVFNELIQAEGILIDENVLAARLGVDITKSNEDWEKLKVKLIEAKYTGAFASAWQRWWGSKVESWWIGLADKQQSLKRLGAKERVNLLNNIFGLSLVAAVPIDPRYSDRYWTICQIKNQPLDSVDGFRASAPDLKPWQTPPYLSARAVLNREGRDKWRINPLESERYDALKDSETKATIK